MDAEAAEINALRPTAWFQTHFKRMVAPLRPGFAQVCCMAYVTGEREEDVLYASEVPPALLGRARADALAALQSFEALAIDTVEKSVVQFIKQPDMYGGQTLSWNASNAEDMEVNISSFTVAHVGIWKDYEFDEYKERLRDDPTLTEEEREALACYVMKFIEYAGVEIPLHVGGGVDVYYDSATTEDENEEEN